MSDKTATERLRELLDERGVEYFESPSGIAWGKLATPMHGRMYRHYAVELDGLLCVNSHCIAPEQAVAATVGRGNLTAEQVREAIMSADRWKKPMGDTGMTNAHLIIRDDGWQAIADKLNATLGRGTCEVDASLYWDVNPDDPYWEHELSCGHTVKWDDPEPPKFCPECGKEVRRTNWDDDQDVIY